MHEPPVIAKFSAGLLVVKINNAFNKSRDFLIYSPRALPDLMTGSRFFATSRRVGINFAEAIIASP